MLVKFINDIHVLVYIETCATTSQFVLFSGTSLVKVCKDDRFSFYKAKNWSFKNKPWYRILCQGEQLVISVFYYLKYIVLILCKPLKDY